MGAYGIMKAASIFKTAIAAFAAGALLTGCSDIDLDPTYPVKLPGGRTVAQGEQAKSATKDKIFGPGGIIIFGGDEDEGASRGGIGVNGFLWRASLDTMSFMPLASADPFGGVIITDWHSPAGSPNERFKATVYILDKKLRADGVRVSVFRQTRDASGGWADAGVSPETRTRLEDTILTRARQLRIADIS